VRDKQLHVVEALILRAMRPAERLSAEELVVRTQRPPVEIKRALASLLASRLIGLETPSTYQLTSAGVMVRHSLGVATAGDPRDFDPVLILDDEDIADDQIDESLDHELGIKDTNGGNNREGQQQ
jgi:hypothetical protein